MRSGVVEVACEGTTFTMMEAMNSTVRYMTGSFLTVIIVTVMLLLLQRNCNVRDRYPECKSYAINSHDDISEV